MSNAHGRHPLCKYIRKTGQSQIYGPFPFKKAATGATNLLIRPKESTFAEKSDPEMLVLNKNTIRAIRQLELRKFRRQEGLFIAEGNKLVEDNLTAMKCRKLIATAAWWDAHPEAAGQAEECYAVTTAEMRRVSLLQSPQEVLGAFAIPAYRLQIEELRTRLSVVLDEIQDPGNLGTIIRLCDWFGINDIICSPTTADCYNPKVVQATMGAIARVRVHYTPLVPFLKTLDGMPVYGTYLEGEDIYETELTPHGLVVMGNEGNGIGHEVDACVTRKLTIPSFACGRASESLNVGIATAIVASEFRRRQRR